MIVMTKTVVYNHIFVVNDYDKDKCNISTGPVLILHLYICLCHRHIFYYTIPLLTSIISTTTRYSVEAIPGVELLHLFY